MIGDKAKAMFWARVERSDNCWNWTGFINERGYGKLCVSTGRKGKPDTYRAHRVSWLLHNGAIPDGLMVLHRCDNRKCVNPAHLFLGTAADNTADMIAKGRQRSCPVRGEAQGASVLRDADVIAMRQLRAKGLRTLELASRFGVSRTTVDRVCLGKGWTHLPGAVAPRNQGQAKAVITRAMNRMRRSDGHPTSAKEPKRTTRKGAA